MQPYRVVTTRAHEMLIFQIRGELDLTTVDACYAELRGSLGPAVGDRGSEHPSGSSDLSSWTMVVLDLRELTFLSAAGLHMPGELTDVLIGRGIDTGIAAEPGSLTRRVLYLAGLDRRAIVLEDLDEHSRAVGVVVCASARLVGARRRRSARTLSVEVDGGEPSPPTGAGAGT